jgi:hypothetical protein
LDLLLPGIEAIPLLDGPRNSGQSLLEMVGVSNITSNINHLFPTVKNTFYRLSIKIDHSRNEILSKTYFNV